MRIAYVIVASDNPNLLSRLLVSLNTPDVHLFIHIDKKSTYVFRLPTRSNITILENNINVYWGGFSFIRAVVALIRESFKHGTFDYYILLSGTTYPVRNNSFIQKYLVKNKGNEYINLCKMPEHNKGFDRIDYYYREVDKSFSLNNIIKRILNRGTRILQLKRKYPEQYKNITPYGGSTWWALTGACIRYIIKYIDDNPELVNYYRNTLIPDETFFHTIIGNSSFKNKVVNSFIFAYWKDQRAAHPVEISETDLDFFKKLKAPIDYGDREADILFARKFTDNNQEVLNTIDDKLRKEIE